MHYLTNNIQRCHLVAGWATIWRVGVDFELIKTLRCGGINCARKLLAD